MSFGPYEVPPGLEALLWSDQLIVRQQVANMEGLVGYDTDNKYTIEAPNGQLLYIAREHNTGLSRNFMGKARSFVIALVDGADNDCVIVKRDLSLQQGEIEVQAPPGNVVGYVRRESGVLHKKFLLLDTMRQPVLKIKAPAWGRGSTVNFTIKSVTDGAELGYINKQWMGGFQDSFTEADIFQLAFPTDLSVACKALLLGATFLIDFMFYEEH